MPGVLVGGEYLLVAGGLVAATGGYFVVTSSLLVGATLLAVRRAGLALKASCATSDADEIRMGRGLRWWQPFGILPSVGFWAHPYARPLTRSPAWLLVLALCSMLTLENRVVGYSAFALLTVAAGALERRTRSRFGAEAGAPGSPPSLHDGAKRALVFIIPIGYLA